MAKKSKRKATRTTKLPETTSLGQARAKKLAAPFIDDIQRIVDEQTEKDLGIAPQSRQQAVAFRKRVTDGIKKR